MSTGTASTATASAPTTTASSPARVQLCPNPVIASSTATSADHTSSTSPRAARWRHGRSAPLRPRADPAGRRPAGRRPTLRWTAPRRAGRPRPRGRPGHRAGARRAVSPAFREPARQPRAAPRTPRNRPSAPRSSRPPTAGQPSATTATAIRPRPSSSHRGQARPGELGVVPLRRVSVTGAVVPFVTWSTSLTRSRHPSSRWPATGPWRCARLNRSRSRARRRSGHGWTRDRRHGHGQGRAGGKQRRPRGTWRGSGSSPTASSTCSSRGSPCSWPGAGNSGRRPTSRGRWPPSRKEPPAGSLLWVLGFGLVALALWQAAEVLRWRSGMVGVGQAPTEAIHEERSRRWPRRSCTPPSPCSRSGTRWAAASRASQSAAAAHGQRLSPWPGGRFLVAVCRAWCLIGSASSTWSRA